MKGKLPLRVREAEIIAISKNTQSLVWVQFSQLDTVLIDK